MSLVSYGLGWLVLAAVALPAIWASHEARRLLVPAWRGAWAALVVVVGTASLVVVGAEAVGTVGLLRPLPLSAFDRHVGWRSLGPSIPVPAGDAS